MNILRRNKLILLACVSLMCFLSFALCGITFNSKTAKATAESITIMDKTGITFNASNDTDAHWVVEDWDENLGGTRMSGTTADYEKVKITIKTTANGDRFSQLILRVDNGGEPYSRLQYPLAVTNNGNGVKEYTFNLADMETESGKATFQIQYIQVIAYGTVGSNVSITFDMKVELLKRDIAPTPPDPSDTPTNPTGDIKLLDITKTNSRNATAISNGQIENRGSCIQIKHLQSGVGKEGTGGCEITVIGEITAQDSTNNTNKTWPINGDYEWWTLDPVDVSSADVINFQDYGSLELTYYVPVGSENYVENIIITMSSAASANATLLNGSGYPYLRKVITAIDEDSDGDGWRAIRFNLDSMQAVNFDWDETTAFYSIEVVFTVRQGTPVGTTFKFDDLFLRKEKCDPVIEMNGSFSLTGTTGTQIDLANSIIATHPMGDELTTSFGVRFSKTEDGAQQAIAISSANFTPYLSGYYFITATVIDSMSASAQTTFIIQVTGNDIDSQAPSISFGSAIKQFMSQPGEVNLSGITITDDIDTNIVPIIKVEELDSEGGVVGYLKITEGKVNLYKPARFKITVSATDASGKSNTSSRTITVSGDASQYPTTPPDGYDTGVDNNQGSTSNRVIINPNNRSGVTNSQVPMATSCSGNIENGGYIIALVAVGMFFAVLIGKSLIKRKNNWK